MNESPMSDTCSLVRVAVSAMKAGPSRETFDAIAQLALVDPNELLPELFLEIEDAAEGVSSSAIVSTDLLPDTAVTAAIIDAVVSEDLQGLRAVVPGDYSEMLPTLLATVVALEHSKTML